jgi:hypothetical protein
MRMRPRLAIPLLSLVLLTVTGCDLVSDPEGPQPEDFEVQEDTSEVRSTDDDVVLGKAAVRQDVAAPLSMARGGMTLSINVPR